MQSRALTVEDETEGNDGSGCSSSVSSLMWLNCKFNAIWSVACHERLSVPPLKYGQDRPGESRNWSMLRPQSNDCIIRKLHFFFWLGAAEDNAGFVGLPGGSVLKRWKLRFVPGWLYVCKIYYRWCTVLSVKTANKYKCLTQSLILSENRRGCDSTTSWTLFKPTFCHWLKPACCCFTPCHTEGEFSKDSLSYIIYISNIYIIYNIFI